MYKMALESKGALMGGEVVASALMEHVFAQTTNSTMMITYHPHTWTQCYFARVPIHSATEKGMVTVCQGSVQPC